MAKSITIDNVVIGVLALIAGILIMVNLLDIRWVVGVFLIVYGLIVLIRR